jgi:cytidylate kinase
VSHSSAPVLTLDGPSATGKGTVAAEVARDCGWGLLDSGALYRAFAYIADQRGVVVQDDAAIRLLGDELDLKCSLGPEGTVVIVWGDVTLSDEIRTESVAQRASYYAERPSVREALLQQQRSNRRLPGLVADGRDMGTRVFPDAKVKIFLTAAPEVRARRRYNQLNEKGINASLAAVEEAIRARDQRDEQREVAPMKAAADAVVIDTTQLEILEVVTKVKALLLCH